MLPKRVYNGLKYSKKSWAEVKRSDKNWSITKREIKEGFERCYDKQLVFVQKAPRDEAFRHFSVDRVLELVRALLSDPEEQRLRKEQFEQAQLARTLESEFEQIRRQIADDVTSEIDKLVDKKLKPLRTKIQKTRDKKTKELLVQTFNTKQKEVSAAIVEEHRDRIKAKLIDQLEPEEKQKYLLYLRENTKRLELEKAYREYLSRPDADRISLVAALISECLRFGREQMAAFVDRDLTSIVEPDFASRMEEEFARVERLFSMMAEKAAAKKT